MSATLDVRAAEALLIALDEADERDACAADPAVLLDKVKCVDATTGDQFEFQLIDPSAPWYWQLGVLRGWMANRLSIVLKARQLGITWLAAGYALWTVLYRPGTRVLVISINEEEAAKVVNRLWDMMQSLPDHLRNGTKVLKPSKGARPNLHIQLQHRDGAISSVIGLPSTPKAGHGETAALVLLDEYAYHEYARQSWKAVLPTASNGGHIIAISTGNGVSASDGQGNFYHHLWKNADQYGVNKQFLRWDSRPDRDAAWYKLNAEALPPAERGEQYPKNENEAFILTGAPFFDLDALTWYADHGIQTPLYRCRFEKVTHDKARLVKGDQGGWTRVYQEPIPGRAYALSADVATGRGADYSAGYVIDLTNMAICAAFHAKLDADQYAYQLHYLGKWFNTALIAVEMGGGYGEPVILSLRDGREGRPAYPRLYRHRQLDRGDQPEAKPYGFPMNSKTRPTVIQYLEESIREHNLPAIDTDLLGELQTFVHRTQNPSPRAQDGCNDDRVMALAIALEMYRQRGHHPDREKRRSQRVKRPHETDYPWQQAA